MCAHLSCKETPFVKRCNQQEHTIPGGAMFCGLAKSRLQVDLSCDETLCDETLCEETLCEETLCEETLCDETLCDETLCDETLWDETLCDKHEVRLQTYPQKEQYTRAKKQKPTRIDYLQTSSARTARTAIQKADQVPILFYPLRQIY